MENNEEDLVEDDLSHAEICREDVIRVKYSEDTFIVFNEKDNIWSFEEEDEEGDFLIFDPEDIPEELLNKERVILIYNLIKEYISRRDSYGDRMS